MSTGPQLTLIEIIRLQMKMTEALAISAGRIARLELGLETLLPPELKERFEQIAQESDDEYQTVNKELKAQLARVMESIERYTNG
ncbi:MAG: hypothetical protein RSE32_16990 [Comamonas sp.]|uniref:hypothetical protein n=1 Tax=Comamonas sp. TaxID=34028 RepID=UPI002FCBC975